VALGSLGFVQGVIIESVPLYSLHGRTLERRGNDPDVWRTLEDLETSRFHPDVAEHPFHFEVVLHPYPRREGAGAYLRVLWKGPGEAAPHESPMPNSPDLASDKMGLVAELSAAAGGALTTLALQALIADQLGRRFRPRTLEPQVPGMVFGPTGLPPGSGASTEVIVAPSHVRHALESLFGILEARAVRGHHLLGPVAVRFAPKTSSLLGMNQGDMNCYIELPSVRTREVLEIYRAWWDALDRAAIPFGCHWGQLHGMTPERVQRFYGNRAERWRAARDRLLPSRDAQRVFSSPLLAEVGLD
jgi:D-arabinono-1,4-lactone oxidase